MHLLILDDKISPPENHVPALQTHFLQMLVSLVLSKEHEVLQEL